MTACTCTHLDNTHAEIGKGKCRMDGCNCDKFKKRQALKISDAALKEHGRALAELARLACENMEDDIENKPQRHSVGKVLTAIKNTLNLMQ